jgi:hypothetical protein
MLDMVNGHFSFFDDVGSKYHFLSRLNPIERCTSLSSIENLKWDHLQALLRVVVVRELDPGYVLIPAFMIFQNIGSKHIFKYLVDSLSLAIHLWVIGQTMDQVSPEGCVQVLPKASDEL